jgi:hypothetical protein
MTRRELLALLGAAPLVSAVDPPAAPVAIARATSYDGDLTAVLATMFDQLGGLGRLVRGKTVTIKLNLTGSPALRFQGKPPGVTHYTHPKVAGAVAHLMGQAGARRIRFVESCAAGGGPMEEYLLDSGWNVRALMGAARASNSKTPTISARRGAIPGSRFPAAPTCIPPSTSITPTKTPTSS